MSAHTCSHAEACPYRPRTGHFSSMPLMLVSGATSMSGMLEKWPVLGRYGHASAWLQVWADMGRAPRTIDAYSRGLAEYLDSCERAGVDPITASRAQVAGYVHELLTRPGRRGPNVVSLDSGAGLANATLQQR